MPVILSKEDGSLSCQHDYTFHLNNIICLLRTYGRIVYLKQTAMSLETILRTFLDFIVYNDSNAIIGCSILLNVVVVP